MRNISVRVGMDSRVDVFGYVDIPCLRSVIVRGNGKDVPSQGGTSHPTMYSVPQHDPRFLRHRPATRGCLACALYTKERRDHCRYRCRKMDFCVKARKEGFSVWHEFPAMPVGSSGVIQLWVLEHVQELRKRNFWLAVFAFIVEVVAYVE